MLLYLDEEKKEKMLIDNVEAYKKYLEDRIAYLNGAAQTRGLSLEEQREIEKDMLIYNKIIDAESQEMDSAKHTL